MTHFKDEVPHLPISGTFRHFVHMSGEYFQADRNDVALVQCTGFEDPHCSYQYNVFTSGSVDDHMHYLGVTLGSDGCGVIR